MSTEDGSGSHPEVLRPPLNVRVFEGVLALVGVAVGGVVLVAAPMSTRWFGGVIAVVLALAGVRLMRSSLVLFPDRVQVRGFLGSRTIDRASITGIRDAGYIEWTDAKGVPRETAVSAFAPGGRTWGTGLLQIRRGPMTSLHEWSGTGPDTTDLGMGRNSTPGSGR